jgi:hypothetical protein
MGSRIKLRLILKLIYRRQLLTITQAIAFQFEPLLTNILSLTTYFATALLDANLDHRLMNLLKFS